MTNQICDLDQKHCVPCEGGVKPLAGAELKEYLTQVPNWQLNQEKMITRELTFKNFQEGLEAVNTIGTLAEAEGHHPNLYLHDYKKLRIELSTHAIKGLSPNDFILAAKIDQVYA